MLADILVIHGLCRSLHQSIITIMLVPLMPLFHCRLQRVLADTKEEVEALVKNYTSPSKLATFVIAMKRSGLLQFMLLLCTDISSFNPFLTIDFM